MIGTFFLSFDLVRNGMLSSVTMNDLASYSINRNKNLKFMNAISMNDLQMPNESSSTTPIRFNKNKFTTPASTQRRRALGLVNHNSNRIDRVSSIGDLSSLNTKQDELVTKNLNSLHPDDDLPHQNHFYEDTFDDLIPTDERIEQLMKNRIGGVNIFTYYGGIENTIRCQSPVCNRLNVSTLLDILN